MLKNVNETNIALKTEQMRLKKDVRDKNVIIYYLKTISSRQSSSASEARASKLIVKARSSRVEKLLSESMKTEFSCSSDF